MCVCVYTCMCVYVSHMCWYPEMPEESLRQPDTGVKGNVELVAMWLFDMVAGNLHLCLLGEQVVLTHQPCLHSLLSPLNRFLYKAATLSISHSDPFHIPEAGPELFCSHKHSLEEDRHLVPPMPRFKVLSWLTNIQLHRGPQQTGIFVILAANPVFPPLHRSVLGPWTTVTSVTL